MENIRKVYDTGKVKVEALKGIDLEIFGGEFVAIVGPSGSGKSTLMNLLGCLDTPTDGTYEIGGCGSRPARRGSRRPRCRRRSRTCRRSACRGSR
ncbi:MAG TPA: ATP-binding cassette domain-containing protein [Thermoanaerobaculia bacterium]|nr:ATP-binding cassette domain-containing protein [Thermoanaerobaculia bacterium]